MKKLRIVYLFLLILLLFGCSSNSENIEVFRFVNHENQITIGESITLNLIYGEYPEDSKVIYTMNQEGIIALEGNVATGLQVGEVEITATIDKVKYAKTKVIVVNTPINSMHINVNKDILYPNDQVTLTVSVRPNDLPNEVEWKLESASQALELVVNANNTATVKAKYVEQTKEQMLAGGIKVVVVATSKYDPTISVKKAFMIRNDKSTSVTVSTPNDVRVLEVKTSIQLETVVTPSTAYQYVTYKSSNEIILKVSDTGLVTAQAVEGEATITVTTYDGKTATITFTVVAAIE